MMLTIVHEQTPVPPPAWQCAWPIIGVLLPFQLGQVAHRALTVKSLCSSSHSCAHSGGFRIKICTTGSPVGQRWLWPVACQWEKMDRSAFEVKSQQWKRRHAAGAPLHESLFVLTVLHALRSRLIGARDLIIDSAPILAWKRADPDAAFGHAPAQHPRPLLRGYRVHTLMCRGSGLPLFFLLSPANFHDAP